MPFPCPILSHAIVIPLSPLPSLSLTPNSCSLSLLTLTSRDQLTPLMEESTKSFRYLWLCGLHGSRHSHGTALRLLTQGNQLFKHQFPCCRCQLIDIGSGKARGRNGIHNYKFGSSAQCHYRACLKGRKTEKGTRKDKREGEREGGGGRGGFLRGHSPFTGMRPELNTRPLIQSTWL